jgi:poly [ADP-ribose] polymerase
MAALGDGSLNSALNNFEKKFKDKTGLNWADRASDPKPKKYAFIERSYDPDSDNEDEDEEPQASAKGAPEEEKPPPKIPDCTLQEPVQNLMKLIFNQEFFAAAMMSLNYDANKLPLGKLSKTTITRGFQALKDLSALLDDPSLATSRWQMSAPAATEHLSNMFYTVIPQYVLPQSYHKAKQKR